MITLHPVGAANGIDYVLATVATSDEEYGKLELAERYSHGTDAPGRWVGRAARWLGLKGTVTYADATALFRDGKGPDGERLGARWVRTRTAEEYYQQLLEREPNATAARRALLRAQAERAGHREARTGWEMVFSPAKSFSVLWGLMDDAGRAVLETIEQEAFDVILERIENEAVWVRIGDGVQDQGDGLVGAVFGHRESRDGDPLFHRHLMISSKVPYGSRWLALDARPLHRLLVSFSEHYHAEIERGMHRYLGLRAQALPSRLGRRSVREYAGMPWELIRAFSRRRAAIEAEIDDGAHRIAQRDGREPTPRQMRQLAQQATLATRSAKRPRTREQERLDWRARARAAGTEPAALLADALAASAKLDQPPDLPLRAIPGLVLARLETERGTFTRANAQAETIRQLVAHRWHIALGEHFQARIETITDTVLDPAFCASLEATEPVIPPTAYLREDQSTIFSPPHSARYTTHRILAAEAEILTHAQKYEHRSRLPASRIDAVLAADAATRGFQPSAEQRAVLHTLFDQPRRLEAVIGRAGAGKTALMRLIGEVARAEHLPVLGLSRSQLQAANLASEAAIRTENTARWLHHSGKPSADQRWRLPPRCIVILDEAAQTSTLDIARLLQQVQAVGGRLILCGDPRQLGAIGAGGIIAHLQQAGGAIQLSENRRFRTPGGAERTWETAAAAAVSEGRDQEAFDAYHLRGRIHTGPATQLADEIAAAYLNDLQDHLASIVIAPDNELAAALADRVRTLRIAAGHVDPARGHITLADGNTASPGDIIETRRNDVYNRPGRARHVTNGDLWTIEAIHPDRSMTVRRLDDRARTRIDVHYADRYAGLGYAVTKDRAQGLTLDTAHTLVTAAFTRNMLYPAITRGRWANHIYLDTGHGIEETTGRALWRTIIGCGATVLTATSIREAAQQHSLTLAALCRRLRYTSEDVLDERIRTSALNVGSLLPAFPAWPALRRLLLDLESEGFDLPRALTAAANERELASAQDPAAVLHWRLTRDRRYGRALTTSREGDPDLPPMLPQFPHPDLLRELGLARHRDQSKDADKNRYISELHAAIGERSETVTAHALALARSGLGWPRHYGPEPPRREELGIRNFTWQERIRAAAHYRDLAGYHGDDPVGPTPADPGLRRLWRYAQPDPDPAYAQAEAAAETSSGAEWADALTPAPASSSEHYPLWLRAVSSVLTYRRFWHYDHETDPIGPRPNEPIQATDWDIADHALRTLRVERLEPGPGALDGSDLRAAAARVDQHRQATDLARELADRVYDLQIRVLAASQAAADATARARAAARAASPRSAALATHARTICAEAAQAVEELAAAREAERTARTAAPRARADLKNAEHALAEYERREAAGESQHGWRAREFGHLSNERLEAAQLAARETATAIRRRIETLAQQASAPASRFPGLAPNPDLIRTEDEQLQAELHRTQHRLEALSAEQTARTSMAPSRRVAEHFARTLTAPHTSAHLPTETGTAPGLSSPAPRMARLLR